MFDIDFSVLRRFWWFNLDNASNNEHKKEIHLCTTSNKKYDEDTKRWLANTELHPINRFNEVSLCGNPQFNFYSFLPCDEEEKRQLSQDNANDEMEPMNRRTSNMSSESLGSMNTVDITPARSKG
eukprot:11935_1